MDFYSCPGRPLHDHNCFHLIITALLFSSLLPSLPPFLPSSYLALCVHLSELSFCQHQRLLNLLITSMTTSTDIGLNHIPSLLRARGQALMQRPFHFPVSLHSFYTFIVWYVATSSLSLTNVHIYIHYNDLLFM